MTSSPGPGTARPNRRPPHLDSRGSAVARHRHCLYAGLAEILLHPALNRFWEEANDAFVLRGPAVLALGLSGGPSGRPDRGGWRLADDAPACAGVRHPS